MTTRPIPDKVFANLALLGGSRVIVYLAIHKLADGSTGYFEAPTRDIAKTAGVSSQTVVRAMPGLVELGLIERMDGGNQFISAKLKLCGMTVDNDVDKPVDIKDDFIVPLSESLQEPIFSFDASPQVTEGGAIKITTGEDYIGIKPLDLDLEEVQVVPTRDEDAVFAAWQEFGPVKHKALTAKTTTQIRAKLKALRSAGYDDPIAEVVEAIKAYSAVLTSDSHFFSYKWTCEEFMRRGLERFLPECDPLDRFKTQTQTAGAISTARGADYYEGV